VNVKAHRLARTRVFFITSIIFLVTELIGPPVGSWMSDRLGASWAYSIWIPTRFLAMLLLIPIPEKVKTELVEPDEPPGAATPTSSESSAERCKKSLLRRKFDDMFRHVRMDLLPILGRCVIVVGIVSLVITNFARTMFEIVVQYMRVRFNWEYEDVSAKSLHATQKHTR
jgi:MFS family permease